MPENTGPGTNGPAPSITLESAREAHHQRIADLNAQRPKPTLEHVPTPEGPVVQEVKTTEAIVQNYRIDKQIEKLNTRRNHHRQKLRDDFDRAS